MIILSKNLCYNFSKRLNCLVPHLIDNHQNDWVKKFIIPQTFVDTGYLLNCIVLKLLQPLQGLVHFLHSVFSLLIFLSYQIILWFQVFGFLAYVNLLFRTLVYC